MFLLFFICQESEFDDGKTIWISPFDIAHRRSRRKKKNVIRDGAIRWVYGLCNKNYIKNVISKIREKNVVWVQRNKLTG